MIKLKSLFRRGQTPSQNSSSSTKHSSNNNRNKSQSTQSLNTAIDNEDKQNSANASSSTKFYPAPQNPLVNIVDSSAERGVDVGDDRSMVININENFTTIPKLRVYFSFLTSLYLNI